MLHPFFIALNPFMLHFETETLSGLSAASRLGLGPRHTPIKCVSGALDPMANRQGRETYRLTPSQMRG